MLKKLDWLFWLLTIIVFSRLFTMAYMPMIDTTEARYGEIARIMAETGDWITPWFDYNVPFWGKPPLSFWLEASSFKLFGVTEFSARLPSWLINLGILSLIYTLSRHFSDHRQALISLLIYSTMGLSFVMSGAVLTDPFLTFATTLSFVSFILSIKSPNSLWRWWFFIGLSIGLLAKGPLVLVLVGGPIFLWLLWRNKWHELRKIPWGYGFFLTAIISLPWYIAAEFKTPGFINYFIVGEHFLRFVDSGWKGDLYGTAHKELYGTIWLHWIWASLPWGLITIGMLIVRWGFSIKPHNFLKEKISDEQALLLLAALFPSLFFTFSGNVLWTYQLPALPPLAILISTLIANANPINKVKRSAFVITTVTIPIVLMLIGLYTHFSPNKLKTEKSLVSYYDKHKNYDTPPLIYIEKAPFSARFYSKGQVVQMTLAELKNMINNRSDTKYFIAVANKSISKVIATLPDNVVITFKNRRYTLLKVNLAN